MLGKLRQRAQEHLRILHITHPALIIMHLLEIPCGIILQDWIHDLNHVPELLERDAETVNGGGLSRLDLTEGLHGPCIRLIHHGKQARRPITPSGIFFQRHVALLDALFQLGELYILDLLARLAQ